MGNEIFSESQTSILYDITFNLSILSCIGSGFICLSSLISSRLRTFAYSLILALALSNIGVDASFLYGTTTDSNSIECFVQGVSHVYFALVGFFVTTAITTTCYRMVVKQDFTRNDRIFPVMCICWGVPLPLSFLPLITNNYGEAGVWCSIVSQFEENVDFWGLFWSITILYIPLWFTVGLNIWMHFAVSKSLHRLERAASSHSEQAGLVKGQSRFLGVIVRLRLYPLVLCICWSWASVNKIYEIVSPSSPQFWLYILQYTFQSLNGVLFALIYVITPSVRAEWKRKLNLLDETLKRTKLSVLVRKKVKANDGDAQENEQLLAGTARLVQ
mmetsp:Transcript_14426/g.21411  ORF Transcript_14426/g.21411 Transcript_14426/m.21411 type:complete len:330 (+) Transcript_14426:42-1031(+)